MLQYLIGASVLLPVGMAFLFIFGRFFAFFGDTLSSRVFDVFALILGFFWFLGLVSLLLCVSVTTLMKQDSDSQDEDDQ